MPRSRLRIPEIQRKAAREEGKSGLSLVIPSTRGCCTSRRNPPRPPITSPQRNLSSPTLYDRAKEARPWGCVSRRPSPLGGPFEMPQDILPPASDNPRSALGVVVMFTIFSLVFLAISPQPRQREASTLNSTSLPHAITSAVAPTSSANGTEEAFSPPAATTASRALKRDEVRALQALLAKRGYNPGPIDGKLGSKTRAAIAKWSAHSGKQNLPSAAAALDALRRL